MPTDSPKSSERAIAQQAQEKFEFYLLSLVFTLLALAIQSATFGANQIKNALELASWLCFLVSGLAGLYRLQWMPVARTTMADTSSIEEEVSQLKKLQLQGQTELLVLGTQTRQPITERLANRSHALSVLNPHIKKLETKVQVGYSVHKWAFILGLVAVIAARAYEPAKALILHILS